VDENKKHTLKQHFTDAADINELMCHLLGPVEGLSILEPSVGHGALIENLLGVAKGIDAVDVDESALDVVRRKVTNQKITLHHCDFIDLFSGDMFSDEHQIKRMWYDAVISNPPYGLYFDLVYRRKLKKAYPHLYVRESFGLFFIFAVSRLRAKGRYVFLLPDTFLTSKNHTPLRQYICSHAALTHIIRFPSKKFETVNFGYGNLCIVVGERRELNADNEIQWLDCFGSNSELSIYDLDRALLMKGADLLDHIEAGWSSARFNINGTVASDWPTLGSLAECRTGIYTGDNNRFIGYDPARVSRRLNGHAIEWRDAVHAIALSREEKEYGLSFEPWYVPLVKGGHRECFERTAWAINWSKAAIDFYKTDKKARFQNSKYYFADGLSVPMVTTGRISASLMRGAVFDQGVVGVFPHNKRWIAPLLLYLNSSFASQYVKGLVNGSANNSANYLKRLPVPTFTEASIDEALRIVQTSRKSQRLLPTACEIFVKKIVESFTTPDKTLDQ